MDPLYAAGGPFLPHSLFPVYESSLYANSVGADVTHRSSGKARTFSDTDLDGFKSSYKTILFGGRVSCSL